MPATNLATVVGRRLREARDRATLTQAALAEEVGIEPDTVSRMERGTRIPSLPMLARLARALDTTVSALTETDEERADAATVPRRLLPIVDRLRDQPPEIVDIAERLLGALTSGK